MPSSPAVTSRASVRPEIQALRAVAIGCVVLYHFWPAVLPAGFVGVDVFFVVSGFLITGLLLRDAERFGRVRLRDFYGRRVRRILPAALVVLSACAVATLLVAPRVEWRPFLQQVLSSALYVQNWHLARDSQIPRRADLESTPVQHFWSLSVEEQFYLLWPLLIIAALWLAVPSTGTSAITPGKSSWSVNVSAAAAMAARPSQVARARVRRSRSPTIAGASASSPPTPNSHARANVEK